jgi:transposase
VQLFFMDEMRYGLMSNYRRSWSKVGKRTEWKNQQEFENGYLYSAVAPLSGESFQLISFEDANSSNTKIFLERLKQEYLKKHLIVILDNAPFHKLKTLRLMEGTTLIFLPPYSPQLNPAERFFQELRKATANRIFDTLGAQEKEIEKKVLEYINDTETVKRLTGYEWIVKQYEKVF